MSDNRLRRYPDILTPRPPPRTRQFFAIASCVITASTHGFPPVVATYAVATRHHASATSLFATTSAAPFWFRAFRSGIAIRSASSAMKSGRKS